MSQRNMVKVQGLTTSFRTGRMGASCESLWLFGFLFVLAFSLVAGSSAIAQPVFVRDLPGTGWEFDEAAYLQSVWRDAASFDALMAAVPERDEDAGFWLERLGRSQDGTRSALLDLAVLHRPDALAVDVRLRVAERALSDADAAIVVPLLLGLTDDLSDSLDAPTRRLLDQIRVRWFVQNGTPDQAESTLNSWVADLSGLPEPVWCELAELVAAPQSASGVWAAALCDDEAPRFGDGPDAVVADSLRRLGRHRYRRGDGQLARQALRRVHRADEAPLGIRCDASALLGRSEDRTGSDEAGEAAYQWVVDHCDEHEDAMARGLLGLGAMCAAERRTQCAEEYLRRLVDEFPTNSRVDDALFQLGELYRRRDDLDARLALAHESLLLAESGFEGDMWRETVWRAAWALEQEGRRSDAIVLLRRATAAAEWDPTYYSQGRFWYVLGLWDFESGDLERAHLSWTRAYHFYPLTFYAALSCDRLTETGSSCDWPQRSTERQPGAPAHWPLGCVSRTARWALLAQSGLPHHAADSLLDSTPESPSRACDERLWLGALLLELAGDFRHSHDIPRRQIHGWQAEVSPEDDRRWEVAYPIPYTQIVDLHAQRTGLSRAFIFGVIREESAFDTGVHSYAGAQGLMQLMPRTARGHAEGIEGEVTIERLWEPETNIHIGTNFLAHLSRHLDGEYVLMAAAYNAGRGAVNRWLGDRPLNDPGLWIEQVGPTQARNYSKRVLSSHEVYRYLYDWP